MVKFLIEYFLIIFIGVGIIWKIILPAFGIGTFLWKTKGKPAPKEPVKAKQDPEDTATNQTNTNEQD